MLFFSFFKKGDRSDSFFFFRSVEPKQSLSEVMHVTSEKEPSNYLFETWNM